MVISINVDKHGETLIDQLISIQPSWCFELFSNPLDGSTTGNMFSQPNWSSQVHTNFLINIKQNPFRSIHHFPYTNHRMDSAWFFYHRGEGRSKGRPSQGDWFPYRKLQNEAIQSRISRCLWLFMFRVRGKGMGTKVIWSDRKWRFKQEIMLWTRAVFCLWLMPKKREILTSGAEQTAYHPWNASGNVQARLPWRVQATDFEPELTWS